MAFLIGFLMTQYPFAAAAMALASEHARERFAHIAQSNRFERPDGVLRIVAHERRSRRR
ncbi:hypothetical protein [Sphingopyxis sp. PAMC25046]|uniref:hypothetical protein n=1 Tax=Sphingopyxis sp. PAMC25046 TaxID=2565556 RepID=UPI001444C885|nr:hypothetical protein [Sphingopyxis sp. PAMC25046]